MLTLLLASRSPARLATLRSAGVEPRVRVSRVDEEAVLRTAAERHGELAPEDLVLLLAQAKAEDVARAQEAEAEDPDTGAAGLPGPDTAMAPADLVLGCDSMLEFDGVAVGKPDGPAQARERWRAMRGRSGVLHTGHWLIDLRPTKDGGTGATFGATSSTTVHFAYLADAEIDAYVATGEPTQVAGAFTIDGLGGPYIERIEGDHHGVVGVSLPLLRTLLQEMDIAWRELRTSPAA